MRVFSIICSCIVIAGCSSTGPMFTEDELQKATASNYQDVTRRQQAPRPTLSREEWLQVTSREYAGITKEQALDAAEQVIRLADGDDFKIFHTDCGFEATRQWVVYLVLAAATGTDFWRVSADPIDGGVKLSVQVNSQSQAITPMPTTGGSWTATTGPLAGRPIDGTALYELFWARMDYLLGKRCDWTTCDMARERIKQGIVWGSTNALCDPFNIKDLVPESARSSVPAKPDLTVQPAKPRSVFCSE